MYLCKLFMYILISIISIMIMSSPLAMTQDTATYILDNGYFKITVQINYDSVGSFTIATSDNHPYPNENVLYGGSAEAPGTSALSLSLPQFNKTYTTYWDQYGPPGFEVRYLPSINYTVMTGDNYVRIEWVLPENITFIEEVYLYGTTLNDSLIEQRVRVINYNNYPIDLWIMFMWDIMINGEDGSVIRFWNQSEPVTDWLEYTTYVGNFSNIDFWQTTNDNLNPLFYIWGSIRLPQGASAPAGFIYDAWPILNRYAWNYTIDTNYYIKGDDTAIAYLFIDTVPASSERVFRQFILAVSGLEEQPPEIITTTITSTDETAIQTCSPETITIVETETYTETQNYTYMVTETRTYTETFTVTDTITDTDTVTETIVSNETSIYGITLTPLLIAILLGFSAIFFILFLIILILYVGKK